MSAHTTTLATLVGGNPRLYTKCRLCGIVLGLDDDTENGFCDDHKSRPQARRMMAAPSAAPKPPVPPAPPAPFTAAERSLVRSVASYMPAVDLLRVLNERRVADLGPSGVPYTLEQLHAEMRACAPTAPASDWSSLRRLLAQAHRSGLLSTIDSQLIEDFATVFQLAPAQLMNLRDVIRHAKEGR